MDGSPGYDSHQASLTSPQKIFSQMQSHTAADQREEEHQLTCTYVVRKITKERKRLPGMATIFREETKQQFFRGEKTYSQLIINPQYLSRSFDSQSGLDTQSMGVGTELSDRPSSL